MTSALFLAAAALTLGGATYKAVGLRRTPSRPAWVFAVTLYTLGVALTLRAPVIARPTDTFLRVPDLNLLMGNAVTLISACCVVTVVVYFTDPTGQRSRHKSRVWIILLLAALTAMTVLFVWSVPLHPDGFVESRSMLYFAYVLIYATYLAGAMTEVCQLCLRHARHTADRYLRLGLRLVETGSLLGILYCVILAGNLVTSNTELGVVTSSILPVASCVLLVIGSTIGGWGPRFGELRDRLADYRSYRRLGPLWRALVEVAPDVIPPQDMASLTIGEKRYRRVIEIRDLILTLRPYRDSAAAAASTAAAESSLAEMAVVEATVIADAIRARRAGRRPAGSPEIAMPPPLGADLATESHWLEAVSAALPKALATPVQRPAAMTTEEGIT